MRESSGDEVGTTTTTIMVKKSGNGGKDSIELALAGAQRLIFC